MSYYFPQTEAAKDTLYRLGVLSKPQGYVSPFTPTNNPEASVENYQTRLTAVGINPPTEPPKTSLFARVIDLLSHPRYATVGFVKGLTTPGDLGTRLKNSLSFAWGGLTGEQEHSFTDILKQAGIKNKLALALGGFIGNVALDPLTYLHPFTAIYKKAVPVEQLDDVAKAVTQVTGETLPQQVTKDVVFDAMAKVKQASEPIISQSISAGQKLSNLGQKMANLLSQNPEDTSEFAKTIGNLLQTTGRITSKTAPTVEDVAKLLTNPNDTEVVKALQSLTPRGRAFAVKIAEAFGSTIDDATTLRAAGIFSRGAGAKWLKDLPDLVKAAEQGTKDLKTVALANGLMAAYSEESGRTFLTFFNKPLVETTVVKKALTSVGHAAYQHVPGVAAFTDTMRRIFQLGGGQFPLRYYFVKAPNFSPEIMQQIGDALASQAVPAAMATALEEVLEPKTTYGVWLEYAANAFKSWSRASHGTAVSGLLQQVATKQPEISGSGLITAPIWSPEAIANEKVRKAIIYYLERDIDDGFAGPAWEAIEKTLTPHELDLVKEIAAKQMISNEIIYDLEKNISLVSTTPYQAKQVYAPHIYLFTRDDRTLNWLLTDMSDVTTRFGKKYPVQLANPHALRQKISSLAKAMALKDQLAKAGLEPVEDALIAFSKRWADMEKLVYEALLVDTLSVLPEGLITSKPVQEGWQKMMMAWGDDFSHEFYIHPELTQMFRTVKNTFTSDAGFLMLKDYLDQATAVIKALQITLNPSFQLRNVIGEAMMNFVAGVSDAATYQKAMQVMASITDPNTVVEIAGKSVPAAEIFRHYAAQGLYSTKLSREGFTGAVKNVVDDLIKTGKGVKLNPMEVGRHLSDFTDTYFRLAQFINGLDQGLTPAGAAEWVRRFHVDYNDLTLVERNVLKKLLPYYTFTAKNIPMQLSVFANNPGLFTGLHALIDSAYQALGNPATSEFLRSNLALPIYDTGDKIVYLNWNLPVSDLYRFQTSLADTVREFAGMLHPFLRVPLELAVNRSLTSWRTIRKPGETTREILPGISVPYWAEYLAEQTLGTPWAARRDIFATEEEEQPLYYEKPKQVPGLSSLLPIKSKRQMQVAQAYELRDYLRELAERYERKGYYIPTIDELKKAGRL